jgi:organic radical activating enzyme
MSNYNSLADKAKEQLDNISPTMCYAKWAQVSLHLTNGMTQSCYHPPPHKINLDEIKRSPSALHNTEEKKHERKLMLNGQRPDGCSYCWKIEDAGHRSDRVYRSGEYWAQNSINDITILKDTGDIIPRYVEVNFNQSCNFKCMYCSPHLSTAWEEEVKEFGPYLITKNDEIYLHNDIESLGKKDLMPIKIKKDQNSYLEAFWKWWPDLYKKLEVFRMTGGEPLMDINTFKILDYIYENPNAWLEVSVTSNFCPPRKELFDKFVEKVKKLEEIQIWEEKDRWNPNSGNNWYVSMALKNFAIFISLDSVFEQAEYIRYGLNFETLTKNINSILNETNNTTLTFINTFNALSVPNFKKYLEFILDLRKAYSKEKQGIKYISIHDPNMKHPDYVIHPRQRIWFDIPLLRDPSWMNIHVLPLEFESYLEDGIEFMMNNTDVENFEGFYDFEIAKAKRNLVIFKDRSKITETESRNNSQNFARFFNEYDERKNLNFNKTFPQLSEFYEKTFAKIY